MFMFIFRREYSTCDLLLPKPPNECYIAAHIWAVVLCAQYPPKYSFGKKNNYFLGINQNREYGPTVNTNFWNGYLPPNCGYAIFINKETIIITLIIIIH